jgi:hypothetical protein
LRIKEKKSGSEMLPALLVSAEGRSIYNRMDYNELGEPYEVISEEASSRLNQQASKTIKKKELAKQESELGSIIHKAIRREIFIRIQKNLILLRVLADSTAKLATSVLQKTSNTPNESAISQVVLLDSLQSLEQVRASQRRVSAVFSPLAYQLYPDQVEALTSYMADLTSACSGNQELPVGLLNEIELPRVQKQFTPDSQIISSTKPVPENVTLFGAGKQGSNNNCEGGATLFSREYHLFLASIYLSEALDQMERVLGSEVEKLARLMRPEVTALENACSKIHKVFTRTLEKQPKWACRLDFKTI